MARHCAAQHAYAPYSKFLRRRAGDAGDGTQYAGCNVENALLHHHAGAVRVLNAVACGTGEINASPPTRRPPPPPPPAALKRCPRVRPDMIIHLALTERMETELLDQLPPHSFGPEMATAQIRLMSDPT